MQHVLLSDQLSNVNPYSFSNANGLKSVAMVFSVNEIGMKAFENCINLEQIYIPDSVSQIHETAFDGCTKLSIYAQDASKAADFAEEKSITIITSPKYELTIAQDLKDASLESLDDLTDNSNETADQTNSEGLLGSTNVVANQAVVLMNNTVADVVSGSNVKWNELLQTSIQDGMIPENLFYLKSDLKKITIPENVLTIGKFSFARSGITQLDIPQSVTKIEYGAFYHCDDLASVSIPSSVSVIEEKAFDNTAWMKEWLASSDNDYLIVGDGVLLAYKGEWKDFEVPADVKYISFSVEK